MLFALGGGGGGLLLCELVVVRLVVVVYKTKLKITPHKIDNEN